jgi:hypothetical protein
MANRVRADMHIERMLALASELVARNVDLIVTFGGGEAGHSVQDRRGSYFCRVVAPKPISPGPIMVGNEQNLCDEQNRPSSNSCPTPLQARVVVKALVRWS